MWRLLTFSPTKSWRAQTCDICFQKWPNYRSTLENVIFEPKYYVYTFAATCGPWQIQSLVTNFYPQHFFTRNLLSIQQLKTIKHKKMWHCIPHVFLLLNLCENILWCFSSKQHAATIKIRQSCDSFYLNVSSTQLTFKTYFKCPVVISFLVRQWARRGLCGSIVTSTAGFWQSLGSQVSSMCG
jgi:hypothetical protein